MNIKEHDGICEICGHQFQPDENAHHLPAGTVLSEKYIIGRVIGEGGFGITYIGRDTNLDMVVAIKEYYPNGYVNRINSANYNITVTGKNNEEFFENGKKKFIREARILAKFSGNKSIVDVRDFFECNNTAYIVMEYIHGVTLSTYIKSNGNFEATDLIQRMLPIFGALKLIHKNGLIHRDISPDNIMILQDGSLKLMDFGAAREVNFDDKKSLSIVLKHGYAPEEQYRSKGEQGPWTDIYAACATIYKCITGITPDESTERVYSDELQPPSHYGIDIPLEYEKTIMKGLAIYQKDRYQSVDELIEAFSPGGSNGVSAVYVTNSSSDSDSDEKTEYYKEDKNSDDKNSDDKTEYYEVNEDLDDKTEYYEENDKMNDIINSANPSKKKKRILSTKGKVAICLGTFGVVIVAAGIIYFPHTNNSHPPQSQENPSNILTSAEATKTIATTDKDSYKLKTKAELIKLIDNSTCAERTFSVQDNLFAYIDKNGKAHQFQIDGSYLKEVDINNNSNYDLEAIEYSYRGNGSGFGIKKDGSVILLSSGRGGYHYEKALPHLNDIVDVVSTTNMFTSESTKNYAWVLGLRKNGTVANILLYEGETDVLTLHDYDTWSEIKSISFESGRPFGLKKDGMVITVENNKTIKYNDFEDIGAMPQDMLNTLNPDIYLKNDGTIIIPSEDSILFSDYWLNVGKWTDIIQFSTSFRNIVGLKSNGTVIAEGPNENGQCNVTSWKDIVAIKTTDQFTIGKKSDGSFLIATNNPTLEKNFNESVNGH